MTKEYNKLVRDNIIDLIKIEGKECSFKYLNSNDFNYALKEKLIEESVEVSKTSNLKELKEELADVMEVFETIINFYQIELTDLIQIKENKCKTKGGFKKRIFLENTL